MPGSASSASYEPCAWGSVHSAAYACAFAGSRLATALSSLRADARIAGMIKRLMRAVPRRPQRRRGISTHPSRWRMRTTDEPVDPWSSVVLLDPHDAVGHAFEPFEYRRV